MRSNATLSKPHFYSGMTMKLHCLFCVFTLALVSQASSQCIPDTTITQAGIYPDTATGLPTAYANTPYDATVQIKVAIDTFVLGQTVLFDSISIMSVSGFPPGFNYTCNVPSCTWAGGANGCADLIGNPAISDTGSYPLGVNIRAYLHSQSLGSFTQDITKYGYKITINAPMGIYSTAPTYLGMEFDNPYSPLGKIIVKCFADAEVFLYLFSVQGDLVAKSTVPMHAGTNEVNLPAEKIIPGFYFLKVQNSTTTVTRKLVIAQR